MKCKKQARNPLPPPAEEKQEYEEEKDYNPGIMLSVCASTSLNG